MPPPVPPLPSPPPLAAARPPPARRRRCRRALAAAAAGIAAAADAAAGCLARARAHSAHLGWLLSFARFQAGLSLLRGLTTNKSHAGGAKLLTNRQTQRCAATRACVDGPAFARFRGGNNCGVLAYGDPHGRARSAARRRHRCESFGRLIPSTPTSVTDHTGHRCRQGHCHRPVMAARLHIEHDRRSRADGWRAASQPAHGPIRRGQWAVQRGRVA